MTNDNVELWKYLEKVARARYTVSEGMYADVIRAQVETGKMDDQLRTLEDMKRPAAAMLNAAINRPAGEPRPLPETVGREEAAEDVDGLFARLHAANPELAAMESEIRAAEAMVTLAKKQSRPGFMAGVEWTDMKKSAMGNGKDMWMLMLGVSIPIWRGKYRAAESEARHERAAATARRDEMLNELSAELADAAFGFRDAERKIVLYGDTLLPKAQQAMKAAQAAYEAGNAQFADLVDAQRSLLEFQLQYERSLADRATSLARMDMLLGDTGKVRQEAGTEASADIEGTR